MGYLWSLNFMQNMRQIYWAYPQKKCCHNRRTDKSNRFGHSSHVFAQARIFPKNSTPPVLSTYGPSTSCKISQKLMRQSWKKCCSNRQMDKLGHFGSPSGKWEIFQKNWPLNFLQNIKKKLMSQFWDKYCDKKWTYVRTDRSKFIELSQSVGPIIERCSKRGMTWYRNHW